VIQSAAVEDSNVDLTKELVDMITAQRNYQANAQTIKTQDQIMQTLLNLR
jgi:flagellar hook protein FlgE